MRERITENEYKAKYLELKYSDPPLTAEEWREEEELREFNLELLLQFMEQNKEILKRKEK